MIRRALLSLAMLFALPVAAEPCGKAEAIGDGWTVAAPEEAGLDGAKLCNLEAFLKQWPTANIHAVVVARHGKLVMEHYL